jgi:hypothetical protein
MLCYTSFIQWIRGYESHHHKKRVSWVTQFSTNGKQFGQVVKRQNALKLPLVEAVEPRKNSRH